VARNRTVEQDLEETELAVNFSVKHPTWPPEKMMGTELRIIAASVINVMYKQYLLFIWSSQAQPVLFTFMLATESHSVFEESPHPTDALK
jgi:hypothetical protein